MIIKKFAIQLTYKSPSLESAAAPFDKRDSASKTHIAKIDTVTAALRLLYMKVDIT